MQQGQISSDCELYGVQLSERVQKLASGQSFMRFFPVNPAWTQELHHALRQLAPWHLAPGLARIQQHLEESTRKPPPPGSWERKLFWFSGQRQQMRWGLGVRLGTSGAPDLDLIATASNEHFPEPDWKRHT